MISMSQLESINCDHTQSSPDMGHIISGTDCWVLDIISYVRSNSFQDADNNMLLIFWGRSFFVAGSVLQPGAVGGWGQGSCLINWPAQTRASNEGYPKVPEDFTITEKAPTTAFSWLKVPTSAI